MMQTNNVKSPSRQHAFKIMELKCQKQTLKLPVISFSGVPPFSFEELHSHFSPVNVFLPAVIKATMLQPDKIPYMRKKQNTHT